MASIEAVRQALSQVMDPELDRSIVDPDRFVLTNCHGTNGKAEGAGRPLAGQPADTLIKILNFARTGLYTGLIMPQIAKGYSEDELKRIATYFSQIK